MRQENIFSDDELDSRSNNYLHRINIILEQQRIQSLVDLRQDSPGPRIIVIGGYESGKGCQSHEILGQFSKALLSQSCFGGWRPIFADLDSDKQSLNCPGTICAEIFKGSVTGTPQRISYNFGFICKSNKQISNAPRLLYERLVSQLGSNVWAKLIQDMQATKVERDKFERQYHLQDQNEFQQQKSLGGLLFSQYCQQREEKQVSVSGAIINCPIISGTLYEQSQFIQKVITHFKVTMVIIIDQNDIAAELDKYLTHPNRIHQQVPCIRIEKIKSSRHSDEQLIPKLQVDLGLKKYLSNFLNRETKRVKKENIMFFQLKENIALNLQRQEVKATLVVGVLHLKQSELLAALQNSNEENQQQIINEKVIQSQLAFIIHIDSYDKESNSYSVHFPGESYSQMLRENVWVSGKLNIRL